MRVKETKEDQKQTTRVGGSVGPGGKGRAGVTAPTEVSHLEALWNLSMEELTD